MARTSQIFCAAFTKAVDLAGPLLAEGNDRMGAAGGESAMAEGRDRLTPMQRDCLRLIWDRYTIDQIAAEVGLSVAGVNYHLRLARNLLGKGSSLAAAKAIFGGELLPDYIPRLVPTNIVDPSPLDGSPGSQQETASQPEPTILRDVASTYDPSVEDVRRDSETVSIAKTGGPDALTSWNRVGRSMLYMMALALIVIALCNAYVQVSRMIHPGQ